MSKLIWGFASLIAAILAIIFGGIAIFFFCYFNCNA